MWASIIAIAQQSKFDPPVGYIHISAINYHPANVYGGSEDEWLTFGSGRMIMGADSQLPMTGGSLLLDASTDAAGAPVTNNSYGVGGYRDRYDINGVHTHDINITLPRNPYIQTYMWRKILYYDTIIYSAGNAMGTFEDVLGSLYPVGAQIYRTNAISAHPSDATKVQPFPTEAPLQQWSLIDNGDHKVLEKLNSPCDTTDLAGRATIENVTASQTLTTSFTQIGGTVTNYTPPVGTKSVTFAFDASHEYVDQNALAEFRLQVCEGTNNTSWNDIVNSSATYYILDGRGAVNLVWTIRFGIGLGNDYTKGTIQAARPVFNMRWVGRNHTTNNELRLHSAYKHSTDDSHVGNAAFTVPHISITAIGDQAQYVYERTA